MLSHRAAIGPAFPAGAGRTISLRESASGLPDRTISLSATLPRCRTLPTALPTALPSALSAKLHTLRFLLVSMVVLVHAENLHVNFQGGTVDAPAFGAAAFVEFLFSGIIGKSAVPLFCFVSGILAFRSGSKGVRQTLARRFRTVLLPYLLWSAAAIALFLGAEKANIFGALVAHERFHHPSIARIAYLFAVAPLPSQLWYLRNLFVCSLLTPVMKALLPRAPAAATGLALSGITVWILGVNDGWRLMQTCVFYFAGGAAVTAFSADGLTRRPCGRTRSILTLIWISGIAVLALQWQSGLDPSPRLIRAAATLGAAVIWFGYDRFAVLLESLLAPLTSLSFFVFLAHEPLQGLIIKLTLHAVNPSSAARIALYFLIPCLVIVLTLLWGSGMRRYAPNLYGLLVGGR